MRQVRFKKRYVFQCEKGSKNKIVINDVLQRILDEKKVTTCRDHKLELKKPYQIIQGSRFKPIRTGIVIIFKKISMFNLKNLILYPGGKSKKLITNDLGLNHEELLEIERIPLHMERCFAYGLYLMSPPEGRPEFEKFLESRIFLHHFSVRKSSLEDYF